MTPLNLARYVDWTAGVGLGLGFLVVLNYLRIPYYLFYPRTTETVLISPGYDYYFFLVSSLAVAGGIGLKRRRLSIASSLGLFSVWAVAFALTALRLPLGVIVLYATAVCASALAVYKSENRGGTFREILSSALAVFVLVEGSSIVYWFAAAVKPFGDVEMFSARVEANLTFFLYPVAIPIMMLLLFSWFWVPLLPRLSRKKNRLLVRYRPSAPKPDLRTTIAALDLFGIVALVVFFYPYLAGQTWIVGQDSYWIYIDPANALNGLAPSQALNTSARHGAYLFFIYLIQLATGVSSALIVKFAPLGLAFCTAVATYFACYRGTRNLSLAVLGSLATLGWLPTTIGIFVGVQDNWFALLVWMAFLIVYFRSTDASRWAYAMLALLSLLILLVHPWTWGVFLVTLLFTTVRSRGRGWSAHSFRSVLAALILALPVGLVGYLLSPSLRFDLTNTVQLYASGPINPQGLLSFGTALENMFYIEGPALSPALLFVCLVGAYGLVRRRELIADYVLGWSAAWCLGSILLAPISLGTGFNEAGLWRMLYISPLPFLLALGMEKCLNLTNRNPPTAVRNSAQPVSTPTSRLTRFAPAMFIAPSVATSFALFTLSDPNLRLVLVLAASFLSLLLAARLPKNRAAEALMGTVLIFVLFNSAFRTLYPLVLDPHTLHSTVATGH